MQNPSLIKYVHLPKPNIVDGTGILIEILA